MNKHPGTAKIVAASGELLLIQNGKQLFLVEVRGQRWQRVAIAVGTLVVILIGLVAGFALLPSDGIGFWLGCTFITCCMAIAVALVCLQFGLYRKKLLPLNQYHHFGCFDLESKLLQTPQGTAVPFQGLSVRREYSGGLSFVRLVAVNATERIILSRLRSTMPFAFRRVINRIEHAGVR